MLHAFVAAKSEFEEADEIDFSSLLLRIIHEMAAIGPIRVLDIGGGKFPMLQHSELPASVEYVLCDISEKELAKAPPQYTEKYCFDICGDVPGDIGTFDIVFSRMLAEHVRSGKRLYQNVFRLLGRNGVCLMYHPTLFAFPFVLNKVIPHDLAKRIVHALYPRRKQRDSVFPAHYSWCTGIGFIEKRRRRALGFDEVDVIRQYSHGYWRRFPVIRSLAAVNHAFNRRLRLTAFCSFAVYYVHRGV
jgi:SAM-dependent methyltransferase